MFQLCIPKRTKKYYQQKKNFICIFWMEVDALKQFMENILFLHVSLTTKFTTKKKKKPVKKPTTFVTTMKIWVLCLNRNNGCSMGFVLLSGALIWLRWWLDACNCFSQLNLIVYEFISYFLASSSSSCFLPFLTFFCVFQKRRVNFLTWF